MGSFLKKTSFILIGVLLIANLLSYMSLWAMRQGNFYKPSFLVHLKETKFDYIVLGASTGLTTLDTEVIDSINGTKGINLSVDDTSIASQYLMLQHFLAEGKSTKVCVLAPSVASYDLSQKALSANDYRFLPYVGRDYVSAYYESFSGTDASVLSKSAYVPMLGVSFYNAEVFYPSLISVMQPERRNRFNAHGNYTYPVQNTSYQDLKAQQSIALAFSNPSLKKIKALCDSQGIALICYLSPIKSQRVTKTSPGYQTINHTAVLKDGRYFFDEIHVNSAGRQLISAQFAKDLNAFLN